MSSPEIHPESLWSKIFKIARTMGDARDFEIIDRLTGGEVYRLKKKAAEERKELSEMTDDIKKDRHPIRRL